MAKRNNFVWNVAGVLIVLFMVLTLPRAIENWGKKVNYNFEFEFLPIGIIPTIKAEYQATAAATLAEVTATHFQVTDLTSGAVLLAKDATNSAFPASTTKMLTALVAKEVYKLDELLPVTKVAIAEDNLVRYKVGEMIAVEDLIKAMLINSSNESAEVLALNYSAGREGFVDLMNQKARAIHLEQSLFVNPAGFDNENITSTAHDLTILAKELLKDEWLKAIVATKTATIKDASGSSSHRLSNTNELLFDFPEVKGVKTGTTDGAGQVLVTLVEKNGHQVLLVVMGSSDRYQDTKTLMSWVDQAVDWVDVDFNNLVN